jgi:COMPASS component SWD3
MLESNTYKNKIISEKQVDSNQISENMNLNNIPEKLSPLVTNIQESCTFLTNSEMILSELKKEDMQFDKERQSKQTFMDCIYDINLLSLLSPPKDTSVEKFECFSLRFDYTDTHIAIGYSNGYVGVLNLETESYKIMKTGDFPVTSIRWKPNPSTKSKNILSSVTADGKITHWHTTSGKALHTMIEQDNPLMCLDYSSDGTLFATAGNDKLVRVYEDSTKSLLSVMKSTSFSQPGHSNRIFALNFHKENQNLLISGGWDNTVQFYDIRQGSIVNSIFGPHICGDSIDSKGDYLLTGSWSVKDQIQLWDLRTFKCFMKVPWEEEKLIYPSYIYTAQFSKYSNNNLFAVGGSNQNTFRIFENETYKKSPQVALNKMDFPCYSIDFANNTNKVAYGCGDGKIRIMQIDRKD